MRFDDWDFDFVWGGPRRRRRRSRRMRWKMFERGDLKFVILRLIAEKPMHGYEVMKALEAESCGTYRASPGSVYPTLQMLEDEGYLTSDQTDGKRTYRITDEGRRYLEKNRDAVDDVFERVSDFADRFFGDGMRELSANFSRLAQTTFEGAMRSGGADEVLERMNEILEEATRSMKSAYRGQSEPEKAEGGSEPAEGRA